MIVVFADGQIETTGTHHELLKTSSTYRKLHDLQFAE
jgi:ABC-type multidrug transport system fused ATPase/permease subunit